MSDDKVVYLDQAFRPMDKGPAIPEQIECSSALATELESLAAMARRGELIGGCVFLTGEDCRHTYSARVGIIPPSILVDLDVMKAKLLADLMDDGKRLD